MKRFSAGSLLAGLVLLVGGDMAHAQIDPFYLDLERDAQTATTRGDVVSAARLYRVACFGMLDDPAHLASCTVRLAKAQAAAKDLDGFRASYLRLATVEERYQGLTHSDLTLEEKADFARIASARLPPESLALIPELSGLIAAEREAQAAANAPSPPKPKSRRTREAKKAAEAPATEAPVEAAKIPEASASEALPEGTTPSEPPGNGAASESVPPTPSAVKEESVPAVDAVAPAPAVTTEIPEAAPAAAPPPKEPPTPTASADQERLDAARKRVAERPDRATVESELEAVRAIADRSPGDVGAARLAGDLAYLLGQWPVCADYYQRAGDPGPEAPLGRFYMAVCLFEIGQTESAAKLIAPSADRLKRTPFVNGYLARILGSSTPP